MIAAQAGPDALLTVRGAVNWLRSHGVRPHTRNAVLSAIARGLLPIAATTPRQILVREKDVEIFAGINSKTATGA